MVQVIELIVLLIGVASFYFFLRQLLKLTDKGQIETNQEQARQFLLAHKYPRVFVPLAILALCLLALFYLRGLPVAQADNAAGQNASLFKEINEKDPGTKAMVVLALAMIIFSFLGHWRIPHFGRACLSAAVVTALAMTSFEVVAGIYVQPVSHLCFFAGTFVMTLFLSSLIGFLSFFRNRRKEYKMKSLASKPK